MNKICLNQKNMFKETDSGNSSENGTKCCNFRVPEIGIKYKVNEKAKRNTVWTKIPAQI